MGSALRSSPPLAGLTEIKLSLLHCLLSSVTGLSRLQVDRPELVPQHRVDLGTIMLNKRGRFREDVELNRGLEGWLRGECYSSRGLGFYSQHPSRAATTARKSSWGDLLPWAYGHLHLCAQTHDEE